MWMSCVAFKYLDSVGPRSDVLKDACGSDLAHVLHTENFKRSACVLFWKVHVNLRHFLPPSCSVLQEATDK